MSESSSDTESSCGWTVISNEGSDIETLGPDNAGECEDGAVSRAPDIPDDVRFSDERGEESLGETSLDLTLREETTTEAAPAQKNGDDVGGEEHVMLCSSSENSDILTLPDSCEAEIDAWKEPVAKEAKEAGSDEFYLGSSSSSQYTFRESETIFPVDQPVQQDGGTSSSEDEEDEMKASPVVRRRRVRRSTTGSEPGDLQEPHRRQEEVVEDIQAHPDARAAPQNQGHVSSTLNKCILLALLIAISMGFGHFYAWIQPLMKNSDDPAPLNRC